MDEVEREYEWLIQRACQEQDNDGAWQLSVQLAEYRERYKNIYEEEVDCE